MRHYLHLILGTASLILCACEGPVDPNNITESCTNESIQFQSSLELTPTNALAKVSASADCAGEMTTLTGTLEVLATTPLKGSRETREYFLVTDSGARRRVVFQGNKPPQASGVRLAVTGIHYPCEMDSLLGRFEIIQASSYKVITPAVTLRKSSSKAGVTGARTAVVILVDFEDAPNLVSSTQASSAFFTELNNYFRETSLQQVSITGRVIGPFKIKRNTPVSCEFFEIEAQVEAAVLAAGENINQVDHRAMVLPKHGCDLRGLGSIGGKSPGISFFNGMVEVSSLAHELGHNLGLGHGNFLNCETKTIDGDGSSCAVEEYRDPTSVMGGYGLAAHYNAFQKEQLGWLAPSGTSLLQEVKSSGTFTLSPYGSGDTQTKALKILRSTDSVTAAKTYLYIEYRKPVGYDANILKAASLQNLTKGVVIHLGTPGNIDSSLLLNMNAGRSYEFQSALEVGKAFEDPMSGTIIRLDSIDEQGAHVSVYVPSTDGSTSCERSEPVLALSGPASPSLSPGGQLYYEVSITNRDSFSCGPTVFAMSATASDGLEAKLGVASLKLLPGTTSKASLGVSALAQAKLGQHSVQVLTTRPGGPEPASRLTAQIQVKIPEDLLTLSTSSSRYMNGQDAELILEMKPLSSNFDNALITLVLTNPTGTPQSFVLKPGTSGKSSFRFTVTKCLPRGTYQAEVSFSASDQVLSRSVKFELR